MTRRQRRVVWKVDTLSVLKFSALLYFSFYLVVLVAAVALWVVATVVGAVHNVESFVKSLFALDSFHFDALLMLRALTVGGILLVLIGSGVNVLLAILYNLISDVVGGVEVTITEPEPKSSRAHRRVQSPG